MKRYIMILAGIALVITAVLACVYGPQLYKKHQDAVRDQKISQTFWSMS